MRFLRRFLARLKNFATGRRDGQRLREERMFRRFTNACFKERMMNLRSSCAGGWTRLEFQRRRASRCSPSTPTFRSLER